MHSAEASTPAPAYGTSRISSSPCTVPSSPNGPWSTGNTQSAPSSPRPGSSATGSPSSDHVPSRAMRTAGPPWPGGGRAAGGPRGAPPGGARAPPPPRRGGDLVLGGAPAAEDGDPHPP